MRFTHTLLTYTIYLTHLSQIIGSNEIMQVKEQSVCDLEIETLTIHSQNVRLVHACVHVSNNSLAVMKCVYIGIALPSLHLAREARVQCV